MRCAGPAPAATLPEGTTNVGSGCGFIQFEDSIHDHRTRMVAPLRYAQQMPARFPVRGDQKLVQIVDAALADAARRSGDWLACRPGCTHCCIGVFAINQLDALRLKQGLANLQQQAPERAEMVRGRARESMGRLSPGFPGDLATGILDESANFAERRCRPPSPCVRTLQRASDHEVGQLNSSARDDHQ